MSRYSLSDTLGYAMPCTSSISILVVVVYATPRCSILLCST